MGDLNLDGIPDVLCANDNRRNIGVRMGLGDGGLSASLQVPSGPGGVGLVGPRAMSLGDIDGDGDLDLVATQYSSTSSQPPVVWTNTAGGNWGTAANWSPNQVTGSAATGDNLTQRQPMP